MTFRPESHAFLPIALIGVAACFGIDASRGRLFATTATFGVALAGAIVALPYAFEADAPVYGLALAGVGLAYAYPIRAFRPDWVDEDARDAVALAAIVISTLPFEAVYADATRIGVAVHFGAALVFACAAVFGRSTRTVGELFGTRDALRVRVAMGWLYAAGAAAVVGYIFVLRSTGAGNSTQSGTLATPLMSAALVFIVAGALVRRVRAELSVHCYIMSLALALGSIALADSAPQLAALLSVYIVAYGALALYEDQPLYAGPAAVFGFAAVEAWRRQSGASLTLVPVSYSAIAVIAYGGAIAARARFARWSEALRAVGSVYGLIAPAAGFAILAATSEGGRVGGTPFERTALYEASTIGVALVGVLAMVEAALSRRRWALVPGSAVLLVALLLEIGRFDPQNVQAYAIPVGAYLVALAVAGLSRMKLIPGLEPAAVYLEALGAATIMLPAYVQSFGAGWGPQILPVVEAVLFLTAGIALRRRGILSAALTFVVLVSGHALFDAINAMPNWIVAMLAGIALLGIGVAILAGRERWDSWQKALLTWWEEADDGALAG